MELKILTKAQLAELYNKEMKTAFPPSELKPLSAMESMRDSGRYEPLGAYEGEELVGYALMWLEPGVPYALLDYLGTVAGRRGTGIGTRLLGMLAARYAHTMGVFGESEAVTATDPDEAALQQRRLEFYERNGFEYAGYDCALFGVHYRTLICTDKPVDGRQVEQAHRAIYRAYMPEKVYRRFIQIPLQPGEEPRPLERWTEE